MIVAGIDIGSSSSKAVIMNDGKILAWNIVPTQPDSNKTAAVVMDNVLRFVGVPMDKIKYIVSTGYGRVNVPFAQRNITEISCHALGNNRLFPEVRTILDIGGQDCKAINCNEQGKVITFAMNDKCAAGTGRYLERIATTLNLSLEEVGNLSVSAIKSPVRIESYCVVFAERDVQILLLQGKNRNDILAGILDAITDRIYSLILRVKLQEAFAISGGVAKIPGVVKRLEDKLGIHFYIANDPQIVGAVGAACFAERLCGTYSKKV
jgi:predicted CoA-substrate-specific enzyme activase